MLLQTQMTAMFSKSAEFRGSFRILSKSTLTTSTNHKFSTIHYIKTNTQSTNTHTYTPSVHTHTLRFLFEFAYKNRPTLQERTLYLRSCECVFVCVQLCVRVWVWMGLSLGDELLTTQSTVHEYARASRSRPPPIFTLPPSPAHPRALASAPHIITHPHYKHTHFIIAVSTAATHWLTAIAALPAESWMCLRRLLIDDWLTARIDSGKRVRRSLLGASRFFFGARSHTRVPFYVVGQLVSSLHQVSQKYFSGTSVLLRQNLCSIFARVCVCVFCFLSLSKCFRVICICANIHTLIISIIIYRSRAFPDDDDDDSANVWLDRNSEIAFIRAVAGGCQLYAVSVV